MIVKLLTENNLEFLNLKRGCSGSSEYTLVKILHCWKSHVAAHLSIPSVKLIIVCTSSHISLDKKKILRKILNIFLTIIFSICFGCSKEPFHRYGSFEYPQHVFRL